MAFLVVLVVAVAVLVLVMRAGAAKWGADGGTRPSRPQRRPRARGPVHLGPDDDPDFLRELPRRTRRDDGSPG